MELRRATYEDTKDILAYMEAYHKDSNMSAIPYDKLSCAQIVDHYIGHRDCYPLIAKEGDSIIGLLFGSLEPYFFNKKYMYATDLMFFSRGAGPQLWRKYKEWAFSMGADRIIMGVSSGDERVGSLLEALGMKSTGGMYVLHQESS